ncbi:hypothetical protein [Amycolatopsis arida]|nr:hypothetical protein [Amycolatopsis arida]
MPDATHWITDEHPDLVNRTIRDHLGNVDSTGEGLRRAVES